MKLEINPSAIATNWAFYLLSDTGGKVQFAGVCQASKLLNIPDARAVPVFPQHFGEGQTAVLEVIKFTMQKKDAINARHYWFTANGWPLLNKQSARGGRGQPIYCVETLECFASSQDAIAAHGLNASQLSNHLNRKPNYLTVKGKTYVRGRPPKSAVPLHKQGATE